MGNTLNPEVIHLLLGQVESFSTEVRHLTLTASAAMHEPVLQAQVGQRSRGIAADVHKAGEKQSMQ